MAVVSMEIGIASTNPFIIMGLFNDPFFILFIGGAKMVYDKDKVDEMVLALLYLTTSRDKYGSRAWKGMDWEVMNRLYEKGYIDNPKSKAKSIALTEQGAKLSREIFKKHFCNPAD
jgi:hypothetical protein